jgi:hypothetical protein
MTTIPERLRHAATTASNDDYSKPGTEARRRHVERVDAMLAGADEIERLETELSRPYGTQVTWDKDGNRIVTPLKRS